MDRDVEDTGEGGIWRRRETYGIVFFRESGLRLRGGGSIRKSGDITASITGFRYMR